jgi:hypothetical protein
LFPQKSRKRERAVDLEDSMGEFSGERGCDGVERKQARSDRRGNHLLN